MSDLVARVTRIRALERPRQESVTLLAEEQHRVVAHWQLLILGLTRTQIQHWIAATRLFTLFRGVYAVGSRKPSWRGRSLAAVLACGVDALLSHRHAVALWELRPIPGGWIDVTAPGRSRHGREGIRIHSVRSLHPDDLTAIDNIPVTSLHRTLLDYAEVARDQQLRLAIEAADRRDLLNGIALDALIARSRGRRGLKPLTAALANHVGPAPWSQSELERQTLVFLRERQFPEPQVNVLVAGELVDFFWPRQRVVVEADGYGWHKTRARFESDRVKDTKLQLAGCRVMRITQSRIQFEADRLEADLRQMLSASASGQ